MKKVFSHLNRVAVLTAATFTTALLLAGCKGAPAAGPRYPNDDEETPRTVRTVAHAAGVSRRDKVGDTINISTEAQLREFAADVLAGNNPDGILLDDITLTQPWTPIGKDNSGASPKITTYTGTFNGNGYTISGLDVTENTSYAGLFALNNGVIQNLTVEGTVTVNQGTNDIDYVAGVVAYNDIDGIVQNVISRVTVNAKGDFAHNIGGIAGFNGWDEYNPDSPHYEQPYQTGGLIYQCRNEGTVTGGFNKIGGIAGENAYQITECVNIGTIVSTKSQSGWPGVGGIAGRNGNNNVASEEGAILNCYNWGEVADQTTASSSHRAYGGITGWSNILSTVENSYTTGQFTQASGSPSAEKNPVIGMADKVDDTKSVNNYSLEGIYAYNKGVVFYTGVIKTQAYMQTQNFVGDLNQKSGPYVYVAGSYPKLSWE